LAIPPLTQFQRTSNPKLKLDSRRFFSPLVNRPSFRRIAILDLALGRQSLQDGVNRSENILVLAHVVALSFETIPDIHGRAGTGGGTFQHFSNGVCEPSVRVDVIRKQFRAFSGKVGSGLTAKRRKTDSASPQLSDSFVCLVKPLLQSFVLAHAFRQFGEGGFQRGKIGGVFRFIGGFIWRHEEHYSHVQRKSKRNVQGVR